MSEASVSPEPGERPSGARQFAERDSTIVMAYRRGVSSRTLANTHGISPRRVEQIVQEWEDWEPSSLSARARGRELAQVNRLIDRAEQLLEDAVLVYSRAVGGKNVAWQIGALRRRQEALELLASVQQAAGILPRNLGTPVELQRTQELFRNMAELLRDPRVPDDIVQRLLELTESQMAPVIEGRALPAAS